ncbi:MAG: hypothetical protein FWG87_07625 [Defluviitaleaceae bacterium]|nr:hypothetical protein [Defluviitaleaceae bacterium]
MDNSVMKVKDWVITFLIMMIPCVNVIMLFVWAFGGAGNENRKTWAQAALIWAAIGFVLAIVANALFLNTLLQLANSF